MVWRRVRAYTKRFVNHLWVDIDCVRSARFSKQQWEVVMGIALDYYTTTQLAIIAVGLHLTSDVCIIIVILIMLIFLFPAYGNAHRGHRSNGTINL